MPLPADWRGKVSPWTTNDQLFTLDHAPCTMYHPGWIVEKQPSASRCVLVWSVCANFWPHSSSTFATGASLCKGEKCSADTVLCPVKFTVLSRVFTWSTCPVVVCCFTRWDIDMSSLKEYISLWCTAECGKLRVASCELQLYQNVSLSPFLSPHQLILQAGSRLGNKRYNNSSILVIIRRRSKGQVL